MALDDLLRTLEDEARARAEAILDRARAEAAQIRGATEAALKARRAAVLREREAELRASGARAIEAARREAAARVLEARADALARIRHRVEGRLEARAADPALLPRLGRDLTEGLGYFGEGPVVVEANGALVEPLRGAVDGRPGVSFVPSARPGLVLRAGDGTVTVDATLAGRLAQVWPALAIELAGRIEEDS